MSEITKQRNERKRTRKKCQESRRHGDAAVTPMADNRFGPWEGRLTTDNSRTSGWLAFLSLHRRVRKSWFSSRVPLPNGEVHDRLTPSAVFFVASTFALCDLFDSAEGCLPSCADVRSSVVWETLISRKKHNVFYQTQSTLIMSPTNAAVVCSAFAIASCGDVCLWYCCSVVEWRLRYYFNFTLIVTLFVSDVLNLNQWISRCSFSTKTIHR